MIVLRGVVVFWIRSPEKFQLSICRDLLDSLRVVFSSREQIQQRLPFRLAVVTPAVERLRVDGHHLE